MNPNEARISEYKIAAAHGSVNTTQVVMDLIAQGFQPFGSATVADGLVYQPMVKYVQSTWMGFR